MGYQDEQIIDGSVGTDTFGLWTDLQRRLRTEQGRFANIVQKHFKNNDDGLGVRMDSAKKIQSDLDIGFRYILQGKKIDKQEIISLMVIFELVIDTVEEEIGVFDAMLMSGIIAAMNPFTKMFPFRDLKAELTAYEAEMKSLNEKLQIAKREKTQAQIDKIIDFAGLVLEFIPEVSLAKKTTFALGALIADGNLGPQQPAPNKIARTTGSTFAEPIIENLGVLKSSMSKVASIGGKINAGYDAFNWSELDEANKNLADIKAALKDQKGFHERVVKQIWDKWAVRVWSLERQLAQGEQNIRDSKSETMVLRQHIDSEISNARYVSPKAWRILA